MKAVLCFYQPHCPPQEIHVNQVRTGQIPFRKTSKWTKWKCCLCLGQFRSQSMWKKSKRAALELKITAIKESCCVVLECSLTRCRTTLSRMYETLSVGSLSQVPCHRTELAVQWQSSLSSFLSDQLSYYAHIKTSWGNPSARKRYLEVGSLLWYFLKWFDWLIFSLPFFPDRVTSTFR